MSLLKIAKILILASTKGILLPEPGAATSKIHALPMYPSFQKHKSI